MSSGGPQGGAPGSGGGGGSDGDGDGGGGGDGGDGDGDLDPRQVRTRTRAIAAARELLLREGLDAITHLRVADAAGVGRKTLYRHWPTRTALLRAALSTADLPHAVPTGELRADLVAHLELLRRALVDGPLAFVLAALIERAAIDPSFRDLREALTEEGCRPLLELLRAAQAREALPRSLDLDRARAALEGPVFYRVLVMAERMRAADVPPIVDAFLASAAPAPAPAAAPVAAPAPAPARRARARATARRRRGG